MKTANVVSYLRNPKRQSCCQCDAVQGNGLSQAVCFCTQVSERASGSSRAGLVAEPLVDGEGLLVAPLGLVVVTPQLGERAELVVAAGHAGLVAEPLVDGERLLV